MVDIAMIIMFSAIYGIGTFVRHEQIRSKCGILVAILAAIDVINILFEMFKATQVATGNSSMTSFQCLREICVYMVTLEVTAFFMLGIAIDRLYCLYYPIKYMKIHTTNYCILFVAISFIPGFILVALAFLTNVEETVPICNPLTALGNQVKTWNLSTMICNVIVLIVYVTSFVGYSSLSSYNVVMKTLSVILTLFLCTWMIGHGTVTLSLFFNFAPDTAQILGSLAAVPNLICHSSTYYIYFWRSKEYRKIFIKQLSVIPGVIFCLPKLKITMVNPTLTGNNNNASRMQTKSKIICFFQTKLNIQIICIIVVCKCKAVFSKIKDAFISLSQGT
uniref:G_PROTEIN_RECEP_F1_2 domain-containing protein n=1 Tax=Rhabditophanes sp. KR3021 TaxID=114890 RepID=A0AC35U3L9_9BILA